MMMTEEDKALVQALRDTAHMLAEAIVAEAGPCVTVADTELLAAAADRLEALATENRQLRDECDRLVTALAEKERPLYDDWGL